jgi:hypothetical protein
LCEFEEGLVTVNPKPNIHPRQVVGWTNIPSRIICELSQELVEYELLNSINVLTFALGSIKNLLITLIKARIEAGSNQKRMVFKSSGFNVIQLIIMILLALRRESKSLKQ